jgi:hypothetical protein
MKARYWDDTLALFTLTYRKLRRRYYWAKRAAARRVTSGIPRSKWQTVQIDKRGAGVRMPLIFVDNTAANDEGAMTALTTYYNSLGDPAIPDPRRVIEHAGTKRRYAP